MEATRVFYIPDGHRRFAKAEGISLSQAYHMGYRVLIDEVIEPMFSTFEVGYLGVFLLSGLNLRRRNDFELNELLANLEVLIPLLQHELRHRCRVRVIDRRQAAQIFPCHEAPLLDLFLASETEDPLPVGPMDLFFRTGGGLRLSGAPRALLGPYTELFSVEKLHPQLKCNDIDEIFNRYRTRYMAETL